MQTYQNVTNYPQTVPNLGIVPPQGTIETDLELSNPNLKLITNQPPAVTERPAPAPQPIQAAPESSPEGEQ